jgi:epoxyqueuosine reductase
MPDALTLRILRRAEDAGIDLVGITSAEPFVRNGVIRDPKDILPGARSIIVSGFFMKDEDASPPILPGRPAGRFSSAYSVRAYTAMEAYQYGILRAALAREGFAAVLNDEYRLPDKLAAIRAGLGRYGKNSVVLTEAFGSSIMFATVVTDAPLEPAGRILEGDPCGSCDLCLRSCPTNAFPAPYRIDRKLCITNWLWGLPAPRDLREKQENRLFGCGDCVRMCPKNRKLEPRRNYPVPIEDVPDRPELIPLAGAAPGFYRKTFAAFPLRAGIDALRGNVVIALGNTADEAGIEPLRTTLGHRKPQIRAYSAWALGRIGGAKARRILREAKAAESESAVLEEIDLALLPSSARG